MSSMLLLAMLMAPDAPLTDTRRLSPLEVERILEEAARKRVAAEKPRARVIEGEVSVSVGTGGHREVSQITVVPVGNEATAIVSIGHEQSTKRKRRR